MRILTIIAAVPITLELIRRGVLSVELGALLIVAITVGVTVVNSLMKVALPIFAILIFVTFHANSDGESMALLLVLLQLFFVLWGIHLMVKGVMGRGKNKD